VKFSLRERIFPLKYAILTLGKCRNNYIPGFQAGDIFLNCDNTELNRSSEIFFFLFPNSIAGRWWVKFILDETFVTARIKYVGQLKRVHRPYSASFVST